MPLQANAFKKVFHFSFKARTSRGLMPDKTSWFITLHNDHRPEVLGIGESGPLPGLSIDAVEDFESSLKAILDEISLRSPSDLSSLLAVVPPEFPSIRFAMETAWLDLANGGKRIIFKNKFIEGSSIPINGLIWMGDMDFMMNQINQKVALGFDCIKLKVGGLDFDRECDVLEYIRKRYFRQNIEIRLDANGAFSLDDALYKLSELKRFNVHSIEQPIKPGQPEMEELCRKSPIPVAFDEELIGINSISERTQLLTRLKPNYIILKPTLLGGLDSCAQWIALAEQNGIGWWVTSALESNIGLNAICQFTGQYEINIPQGLGTGGIYENNVKSPLQVEKGFIKYNRELEWDTTEAGF